MTAGKDRLFNPTPMKPQDLTENIPYSFAASDDYMLILEKYAQRTLITNNRLIIMCPSFQEAERLFYVFKALKVRWNDGRLCDPFVNTNWLNYGEKTCYVLEHDPIHDQYQITYCTLNSLESIMSYNFDPNGDLRKHTIMTASAFLHPSVLL